MDTEQEKTSHLPIESTETEEQSQIIPIRRKYTETLNEDLTEEMDEDIFNEPGVVIREKEKSHTWVWLLAGLVFVLFVGFGYSAGWFNPEEKKGEVPETVLQATNEDKKLPPVPEQSAELSFFGIESSGEAPNQQKTLIMKGELDSCTRLNEPLQGREGELFGVVLGTEKKEACLNPKKETFEKELVLQTQNLPNGTYKVSINGKYKLEFSIEGQREITSETK